VAIVGVELHFRTQRGDLGVHIDVRDAELGRRLGERSGEVVVEEMRQDQRVVVERRF
jgi:hypothetical protein